LNKHLQRIRAEGVDDTGMAAAGGADDAPVAAGVVVPAEVLLASAQAVVLQVVFPVPAELPLAVVPVAVPVVIPVPEELLLSEVQVVALVPEVVPAGVAQVVVVPVVAAVCLLFACRTGCRNWRFLHRYRIVNKTSK